MPVSPTKVTPSMREMGVTGTPIWSGQINWDENAVFNSLTTAIPIYKKMRNDPTLWACYLVKSLPIRSAKWWVEAASDSSSDKANAAFVEEALFERMSVTFDRFLAEVCDKFIFGFTPFEKVWKIEEGKVWLKKLAIRLPETCAGWETDKAGGPKAFKQFTLDAKGQKVEVSIPIEKLIVFVNRQVGANLIGRSDYRACYRNWWTKDKLQRLELIDFERGAVGVPTLRLPPSATADDKNTALSIVGAIRKDEKGGVVLPANWEPGTWPSVANLSSSSEMIRRYNREMFTAFLAQFIDLGSTDVGSFALSADQSGLFLMSLEAEANEIAMVMDRYVIPQLCDYNSLPIKNHQYPRMCHQDLGRFDAVAFAQVLNALAESDWLPPREEMDEKFLRRKLKLPEPENYASKTIKDKKQEKLQQQQEKYGSVTGAGKRTQDEKILPFQKQEQNPVKTRYKNRFPEPSKTGKLAEDDGLVEIGPDRIEEDNPELKEIADEISALMLKTIDAREKELLAIPDDIWEAAVENSNAYR